MRIILLVLSFFALGLSNVYALDIIKPNANSTTVYCDYIQISGNVNSGSTLFINSKKIELDEENYFEYNVALSKGNNKITITETHFDKTIETEDFYIKRKETSLTKIKPYIVKNKECDFLAEK